jgi:hypothetical protein
MGRRVTRLGKQSRAKLKGMCVEHMIEIGGGLDAQRKYRLPGVRGSHSAFLLKSGLDPHRMRTGCFQH